MGSLDKKSFLHQLSPVDHLSPCVHALKLLYLATNKEPKIIITTLRNALAKSIAALPILGVSVGLMEGAFQSGTNYCLGTLLHCRGHSVKEGSKELL
jgi:hypothetical protein